MNDLNIIDDERNRGTAARKALRDAVKAASSARSWADAQLGWDIDGWPEIDETCEGTCVCGQDGLKYLYTVIDRVTGATLYPIGSTCIVEHFGDAPVMMARLATLRAVAAVTTALRGHGGFLDLKRDLTPTRIRALRAEGIVGGDIASRLMTLRRRRRPLTLDQHTWAERTLREIVAPALGGEAGAEIIDDPAYHAGYRGGRFGDAVQPSAYVIGLHDARHLDDLMYGGAA